MKYIITLFTGVCLSCAVSFAQPKFDPNGVYLIIRGDDIASSQAANEACIKSYREGILKSTEIMVPSPWFTEAVKLLKENPGLDVGVHLVLTSEWENIKWRPLTCSPSLVDSNGYFYPMLWKRNDFPPHTSLLEASWKLSEIEAEFRAQLEMAKKHIPQVSHISAHMGCTDIDGSVTKMADKLAREYKIDINPGKYNVKYFDGFNGSQSEETKEATFIANLKKLKPGVYLFVEHPGLNTPEMNHLGHLGYYTVAGERQLVTDLFTSQAVKSAIKDKNIRVISYSDLPKLKP